MPYLQPFLNLKTLQVNISMVPWNKLYTAVFFGTDVTSCLSNHHLNSAGQGLKQTDVATFESFFTDFTDFYRQHLEINGAFVATRYPNQAVLAVPDEETAYPYRDIKTHLYVTLFTHHLRHQYFLKFPFWHANQTGFLKTYIPTILLWITLSSPS